MSSFAKRKNTVNMISIQLLCCEVECVDDLLQWHYPQVHESLQKEYTDNDVIHITNIIHLLHDPPTGPSNPLDFTGSTYVHYFYRNNQDLPANHRIKHIFFQSMVAFKTTRIMFIFPTGTFLSIYR